LNVVLILDVSAPIANCRKGNKEIAKNAKFLILIINTLHPLR